MISSKRAEELLRNGKPGIIFALNGTSMYSLPDKGSEIIALICPHEEVMVYNEVNGYLFVSNRGDFGYVTKGDVVMRFK